VDTGGLVPGKLAPNTVFDHLPGKMRGDLGILGRKLSDHPRRLILLDQPLSYSGEIGYN